MNISNSFIHFDFELNSPKAEERDRERNVQVEAARAVPPEIMEFTGVREFKGRPRPQPPLHGHCHSHY